MRVAVADLLAAEGEFASTPQNVRVPTLTLPQRDEPEAERSPHSSSADCSGDGQAAQFTSPKACNKPVSDVPPTTPPKRTSSSLPPCSSPECRLPPSAYLSPGNGGVRERQQHVDTPSPQQAQYRTRQGACGISQAQAAAAALQATQATQAAQTAQAAVQAAAQQVVQAAQAQVQAAQVQAAQVQAAQALSAQAAQAANQFVRMPLLPSSAGSVGATPTGMPATPVQRSPFFSQTPGAGSGSTGGGAMQWGSSASTPNLPFVLSPSPDGRCSMVPFQFGRPACHIQSPVVAAPPLPFATPPQRHYGSQGLTPGPKPPHSLDMLNNVDQGTSNDQMAAWIAEWRRGNNVD